MAKDYTLLIGTAGQGLNVGADGGESWTKINQPIWHESNVRALCVYPDNPRRVLAGADCQSVPSSQVGVFRSEDGGATWENLDAPTADLEIWSVTVDPTDPDTLFVGTRPEGFRSRDGGRTWSKLPMGVNMNCPISEPLPPSPPRTTCMIVDPRDNRTIWAGMEVDGVYKSLDGGDSWDHLPDLGPDPFQGDIHSMALKTGARSAVYCTSPFGIATSLDEGESWDYHYFPKFHEADQVSYCRGMVIKADNPDVMFVGNGDVIPGVTGAVQRTQDAGKSWQPVSLPVEPNSIIYGISSHKERPNVIVAASIFGYVYLSEDGGDSWQKLQKEFGEVRSVALLPN